MALRVLLADESSTIKKVFQLALQDYAVEVKPVALGVDVATVAQDFKPDILFADVLLQKRNGYEVCAELKAHPELSKIPVVLMWSGFMELDQDKFQACGANNSLEKPFDVAQLRKVVNELVPKTKTQTISKYLEFPTLPEIEEQPPEDADLSLSEDTDEFKPVSIPKMNTQKEKFQVQVDPLGEDEAEISFHSSTGIKINPKVLATEPDLDLDTGDDEDFAFHKPGQPNIRQPSLTATNFKVPTQNTSSGFELSREEIYEIVERLAPKIIEEIAWKIVPDLATQIIEREIKNLLAEKEKQIST